MSDWEELIDSTPKKGKKRKRGTTETNDDLFGLQYLVKSQVPKTPKRNYKQEEKEKVETPVLDYLNSLPNCKAWKMNAGKVKTAWGSWFTGVPEGFSDILVCLNGRFGVIECKAPGKRPKRYPTGKGKKASRIRAQWDFIEEVKALGGFGFFCDDPQQAVEWYEANKQIQ